MRTDKSVTKILERFLPNASNTVPPNMGTADEFVVQSVKPSDEQAKQADFDEANKFEVDGLMGRDI